MPAVTSASIMAPECAKSTFSSMSPWQSSSAPSSFRRGSAQNTEEINKTREIERKGGRER